MFYRKVTELSLNPEISVQLFLGVSKGIIYRTLSNDNLLK